MAGCHNYAKYQALPVFLHVLRCKQLYAQATDSLGISFAHTAVYQCIGQKANMPLARQSYLSAV